MNTRPMSRHLSRLDIARSLLREPDAPSDPALSAHLGSCEQCRRAVSEAHSDAERFHASVLPRTLAAMERSRSRRTKRLLLLWASVATATGALALWLVHDGSRFPGRNRAASPQGAVLAVKGGPTLQVYLSRGDTVVALREGARVQPGDRLRFAVNPAAARFVLVAGVDGSGAASVYYPSTAVPGGRTVLPDAIALDDVPGPERIYALFSDHPLDATEVIRALKTGTIGAPQVSVPFVLRSLSLQKEAPRK